MIQVLYGANFQEAAIVLKIYIWGFVFVSLGVASSHWLVSENLELHALLRSLSGAIISFIPFISLIIIGEYHIEYLVFYLGGITIIIIRHKENIKRLINNNERKF